MKRTRPNFFHLVATLLIVLIPSVTGHAKLPDSDASKKLDRVTTMIQSTLDRIDSDLEKAASALSGMDPASDGAKKILTDLCNGGDHLVDCAIINSEGTITTIEPHKFQKFVDSNVNHQEHFQTMKKTLKPVLSHQFKAVEGFHAVEIGYPIVSGKKFKGAVSVIIRPANFLRGIIKPELARNVTNIWVIDADGRIIFSRYAKAIGDNPVKDVTYAGSKSLISLIIEVLKDKSGSMDYKMKPLGSANPRTKACYWKTAGLHGTEWRVLLFGPERA